MLGDPLHAQITTYSVLNSVNWSAAAHTTGYPTPHNSGGGGRGGGGEGGGGEGFVPMSTCSELILVSYVSPIVCLFGIACNALNLVILTRRNMTGSPYTYLLGKYVHISTG